MTDALYLKALAKGLNIQDTKSLSVIMGPDELKKTLSGLTLKDFDDGRRLITLHTHTTASDGRVEPKDYLDNALKFKNKYGYQELILAVTDHDDLSGLPIILKKAQKNPEKYRGIRLVLGCELSVALFDDRTFRPVDFELLHYGINPFDKTYQKWLKDLCSLRQKMIPKIFDYFQKKYPWVHFDMNEFFGIYPQMKKGFGCYLTYSTPRYIIGKLNDASQNEFVWDYFRRLGTPFSETPDVPFWHTLDDVVKRLKQHGFGFLSMAHPYRVHLEGKIRESGIDFLNYFLNVLKQKGVAGLEIFYMNLYQPLARSFDYMSKGCSPISDTDRWVKTFLDFADQNGMIKTGGTDSHSDFLAGRKRELTIRLTELLDNYKPLIREGYQVLNKEVTLGMPAPCMPPESAYRDTGIGSDAGEGATRIARFFGGLFDKIQLGPMGRTMREAKHSPYVSDMAPNPFFIPLEKLAEKNLISSKTLDEIYQIPKQDGFIDFDIVEKVYDKALHEAYKTCKTKKSYDSFVADLYNACHQKLPAKYIADLQVRIPPDTKGLKPDLFLSDYSLGAPPDAFSASARNWHFSVFDPKKVFNPDGTLGPAGKVWQSLLDTALQNAAGGLRIDHYIGFVNPFVISNNDPADCGRLYSSGDHPNLKAYLKSDFSDITRKIILDTVQKHGLTQRDIYVEDVGNRPFELDPVMRECGLGRLLIAQFLEPDDWNHMYHLSRAGADDVAVLDTHDTPSIQMFFDSLPEDKKAKFSWILAMDLRFNYTDELKSTTWLTRMMWGALMASPAQRVQAFFTSWTGQIGRYNQPGNPVKWHLRCVADFERLYFENLARGLAYNPFDAIALGIYARGDEFYRNHEDLVKRLRAAEEEILSLAREL
ncbi:MAG: 4-alpha-glucanotransferase [Alphaproteobacteria bacterium]|nr:4-alpha-glucanotransferase [Alphaproteobacteria bacterium]